MSYENFKKLKKDLLKDDEIKGYYNELEPEFELIKMIIKKRNEEGITQKELAEKAGTKQSAISRFESGDYNPSVNFLKKLAKALDSEIKITLK